MKCTEIRRADVELTQRRQWNGTLAGFDYGQGRQPGPKPHGCFCVELVSPRGGQFRLGLVGGMPQNQSPRPDDHPHVPKAIPPPRRRPGAIKGADLIQVFCLMALTKMKGASWLRGVSQTDSCRGANKSRQVCAIKSGIMGLQTINCLEETNGGMELDLA